ncbi:hypothetical protein [Salidesulfovibrio brasiliensis]|uniref:hypothetical protein n=1 Tax=Salidesulfovibrio brasiliensis TaxID=221711 RepID=UPI0006D2683E|nr:hypothetical protein [Salidesulfovibrio brasiliensis]
MRLPLATMTLLTMVLTGLTLIPAVDAAAHGLGHRLLESGQATVFETSYSTGEPVAYGEVLVYGPGEGKAEYQNGRTDANGRFAFVPNADGRWNVVVDAGMGHRHTFDVEVDESGRVVSREVKQGTMIPALLGVSLLANLGLAGLLLRRRRA